jgi:hypothetical protein
MVKLSLTDWECSEVIFAYVGLHFEDFCEANIEDSVSCLEYVSNHFSDFKEWASSVGYDVSR